MAAALAVTCPTAALAQYSAQGTVDLGNAYGGAAAMMGPASMSNSVLCLSSPVFCSSDKSKPSSKPGQAHTAAKPISQELQKQVQDAVMSPVTQEYNRRVASDGQERAKAWYLAAAHDLGGRAGGLAPEYQRRVTSDGRAKADAWYVATAGELARHYVQGG